MSKILRWLVPALALVLVIALAMFLYPRLAQRYDPQTEPAAEQKEETVVLTEAPVSTPETDDTAETAPDFTVEDGQGGSVSLSDFAGQPVVINCWASWCPPCRSELPAFDKLYSEYGDRIAFLMVDLTDGQRETMPGAKTFVAQEGYQFPVYFDTQFDATQAYQIYSIPVTIFVRPDGTIAAQEIGAMQENILRTYLEDLLEN